MIHFNFFSQEDSKPAAVKPAKKNAVKKAAPAKKKTARVETTDAPAPAGPKMTKAQRDAFKAKAKKDMGY
jgi:hypothetical protein